MHTRQWMRRQQLQHTDKLPYAGPRPVTFFQTLPELQEYGRKLPVAVHIRVIKRGRATLQSRQIVQGIKHLVAGLITAFVCGHDGVLMHDLHTIDVAFHRYRLEGTWSRHAVAHLVETGELILVDFRLLTNAGVEAVRW